VPRVSRASYVLHGKRGEKEKTGGAPDAGSWNHIPGHAVYGLRQRGGHASWLAVVVEFIINPHPSCRPSGCRATLSRPAASLSL